MKWVEQLREFPPFKRFHLFGIAGSIVVAAAAVAAMVPYVGTQGEAFSPLNHFISELGHVGVSRFAAVFNAGLVAGGVLFVPFALGLGTLLGGWWAAAGTAAGLVAAVSVASVGLFPMNNLEPHLMAATTYFRSGLASMLFFGIAIQRQRPDRRLISRWTNVATLLAVLAYAVFLVLLWRDAETASDLNELLLANRPDFWTAAVLEWSVMASSILWFLVVGLGRRGTR